MAQTNYTPIQIYYSTTAAAVPVNTNLLNGELAINITDGKLYYKDNSGTVQVIATKGAGTIGGSTTQIQYNNAGALAGSSAMVFNNSTNVITLTTLNLTNALGAIYGGTGLTSYTTGDLLYSSASNTLAKLAIGTANYILTVNSGGTNVQWSAPSAISVSTATNLAGGVAGSVPYQSGASTTTFLGIGAADRVMTSSGTAPQWVTALTGLTGVSSSSITNTSLTSGRVVYSGTGGLQTNSANLTFDGTTLTTTGVSNTGTSTIVKLLTVGNTSFNGTTVFAAATPAKLYMGTGTVTDTTSAIGATNAVGAVASLAITPIAATNTSVTYTDAATLYIAGAPSAGTNITITNPYALYVAAGASYLNSLSLGTVLPTTSGGTGLTSFTANGVVYASSTSALATGSALVFDAANTALSVGGAALGTAANRTVFTLNGVSSNFLSFGIGGTRVAHFYSDANEFAIANAAGASGFITMQTNGSERMRLDSSGNLGLGVTPSAFLSTWKVFQIGYTGSLATQTATNIISLDSNRYQNTSNQSIYIQNGYASSYYQYLGQHVWQNAPSGTAGNAITFTQAMTLDASGNLGIGTSSPASKLDVSGTVRSTTQTAPASGAGMELFYDTGGAVGYLISYNRSTSAYKQMNLGASLYSFGISGSTAMTLDASGNLGIGTSSPTELLTVGNASGAKNILLKSTDNNVALKLAPGNGATAGLRFNNSAGTQHWNIFETTGASGQQGNLGIYNEVGAYTALTLDTSGNLLVGTTNNTATAGIIHGQSATNSTAVGAYAKGTTSSAVGFYCKTDSANALYAYWNCNGVNTGTISTNGTITVYGTTSDYRLKTVIGNVTGHGERIDLLKPTEYTWNSNGSRTRGFLAHEFQEVYADSVTGTKDAIDDKGSPKYQAMQAGSSEVIADLVAEIQSLRKRLATAGI